MLTAANMKIEPAAAPVPTNQNFDAGSGTTSPVRGNLGPIDPLTSFLRVQCHQKLVRKQPLSDAARQSYFLSVDSIGFGRRTTPSIE